MYCPDCGTQNFESDSFCTKCGRAFPTKIINEIQKTETQKTVVVNKNKEGKYSIPEIKDGQQINIVFNPETTIKKDEEHPIIGLIVFIIIFVFIIGPCCVIV